MEEPTAGPSVPPSAVRHSVVEDVLGILTGTFAASLGLFLLKSSAAVTGGTAGLALLLSYSVALPFGVIFFSVNLPFFALAVWKKGWNFALRTGAAIALVSVMASLHPAALGPLHIDPVYGVLGGNLLAGVGLLILFRHQSSLGGFNILALLVQEKLKWRAGYVQMVLDVAIVLASLVLVTPLMVLLSAAGATLLNLIVALNLFSPPKHLKYLHGDVCCRPYDNNRNHRCRTYWKPGCTEGRGTGLRRSHQQLPRAGDPAGPRFRTGTKGAGGHRSRGSSPWRLRRGNGAAEELQGHTGGAADGQGCDRYQQLLLGAGWQDPRPGQR
jgi:hypothetical protein